MAATILGPEIRESRQPLGGGSQLPLDPAQEGGQNVLHRLVCQGDGLAFHPFYRHAPDVRAAFQLEIFHERVPPV